MDIYDISRKVREFSRISVEEARILYEGSGLLELGELASIVRMEKANPYIASYIVDRNINYTNICITGCSFCTFYRDMSSDEGYLLSMDDIAIKIKEAEELGATGILLQGGLNPRLGISYYEDLLSFIKSVSNIHIHAFSPPEIVYIGRLEQMGIREVLRSLLDAGLDSIPGGGAEILVDELRQKISPKKCSSQEWLEVMECAHALGLDTTATMMFGHIEVLEDILVHLSKIRDLQDRTGGFTAFIPWTFQKGRSSLDSKHLYSYSYLKVLSLARIFLDNIVNIQGSWVTQGEEIGQMSLYFGANDLGSIMIEENVVRSAGTAFRMSEDKMRRLISQACLKPFKRNSIYSNVPKE